MFHDNGRQHIKLYSKCWASSCNVIRWPTTVTSNSNRSHQIQMAHIKFKLLTSNSNRSHQIQMAHIKFKLLTSNSNRSHQIQITHIKFKSLTSNSNRSHQIQITHIKFKLLTSNSNRVSDWSAAMSMNTILSFHSLFHFTAILCDRYFQCMLSV